jgi:DNA-binding Lrp family transcriptional regulator
MLDATDKKIIAALQSDFPIVKEPFAFIASSLGLSHQELLERLIKYQQEGKLRRLGTVLRHREIGYVANALCAWMVAEERLEDVAAIMTSSQAVTHCYVRKAYPEWPYNFYIMLHGRTRDECCQLASRLANRAGLGEGNMMFSTREWKKAGMKYFDVNNE